MKHQHVLELFDEVNGQRYKTHSLLYVSEAGKLADAIKARTALLVNGEVRMVDPDDVIWTHRPVPVAFDLKVARAMFEAIADKVLSDHEQPVDFQDDPGYPDGRYYSVTVRCAWMVFIERELQRLYPDQSADGACAVCSSSEVVAATEKDHEGNSVEMACPECKPNMVEPGAPSMDWLPMVLPPAIEKLWTGRNVYVRAARLADIIRDGWSRGLSHGQVISEASAAGYASCVVGPMLGEAWMRLDAEMEASQALAKVDEFGFNYGKPVEPDGPCEWCQQPTVFAPVGGHGLCSACAQKQSDICDVNEAVKQALEVIGNMRKHGTIDTPSFALAELADAPPIWLDDINFFKQRLRLAGWHNISDEGIKEMFDEAWAMRPALKPVDQALVDGIIKPYGANMVEVMSSLKRGQSLVVTPHDAATGKGYSMKVIGEGMIK